MELRAEAGGVMTIALESSLRLPNPQDDLTKKYRQAMNELNSFKNRQPRLSLALSLPDSDMSSPCEVAFELDRDSKPVDIAAAMNEAKRRHPKQSDAKSQGEHLLGMNGALSGFISKERWERYDRELDEFYGR